MGIAFLWDFNCGNLFYCDWSNDGENCSNALARAIFSGVE